MSISVVHAYRDDGPMSVLTRWKPRRVECTETPTHLSLPGSMFVVKYATGRLQCTCGISELVCTQLLSSVGLKTFTPYIVKVSQNFAASCNLKSDFPYPISAGEHFGTMLDYDVEDGPPLAVDILWRPWDLVLLWVADTWIGNIDREINGNTVLRHVGGSKFDLIAADQSDCFGGVGQFCSADFPGVFLKQRKAPSPKILAAAIAKSGGITAVASAISQVQNASKDIARVVSSVPTQWWHTSGINPVSLVDALRMRATKLTSIMKPEEWELPHGVSI